MSVRHKITWIVLLLLAAVIKVLSFFPAAVEKYYSTGVYLLLSRLQRILFGWLPFSFGDLLYLAVIVWLFVALVRTIRTFIRREAGWAWFVSFARKTLFVCLWVYVLFNGLWGLNYDRKGLAYQLQLKVHPYSTDELKELTTRLVLKLNELDSIGRTDRPKLDRHRYLFAGAVAAYDSLSARDSRFSYPYSSIKPSLFSYIGLYIGYSGYYNPFTGEAQVNTCQLGFTQPYTTCHEMGHQLGYARENEANFAGYLSGHDCPDPGFRYSTYFDFWMYATGELYNRDSVFVKGLVKQLHPQVRQDFRDLRAFLRKYANPLESRVWQIYGGYLRANRQPKGIVTYTEVTAWLIAYAEKVGWDNI
ncbi:DUF3810 domain-containing protein [Puia dinghuensis]|uniref:DUF3810 domain-containing protein n=1 Tax=Puia dinghuensis TaxID=1792502 RepID=A0A8J2XS44_9BACT|nr:DUF3810 domain-containing protein [Puia dinghuensis]GGA89388.1 hypothetical protein GCM10011511_10760 [Puia dinghuensis]